MPEQTTDEPAVTYPGAFGFDVDHDAPGHFPENLVSHRWTLHLDDEDIEVFATQRLLDAEHPALHNFDPAATGTPSPPALIAMEGRLYINDGHHRLAGARRAGVSIDVDIYYDPDADDD